MLNVIVALILILSYIYVSTFSKKTVNTFFFYSSENLMTFCTLLNPLVLRSLETGGVKFGGVKSSFLESEFTSFCSGVGVSGEDGEPKTGLHLVFRVFSLTWHFFTVLICLFSPFLSPSSSVWSISMWFFTLCILIWGLWWWWLLCSLWKLAFVCCGLFWGTFEMWQWLVWVWVAPMFCSF